ncbi:MAG: hypothetical protein VKI82_00095 [Leptolyngbya sp.]|nr:hypothetical protein [Leptolyngbya sp.]
MGCTITGIARGTETADFWDAYVTVIPSKRHEAVGKDSGCNGDA